MYGSGIRYAPTKALATFPIPERMDDMRAIGAKYFSFRKRCENGFQESLTSIYNRFHEPDEGSDEMQQLRLLHVELDKAVITAYGWDDLDLGHGFHHTKQGLRFTVSEEARQKLLQRLLKLNHERYAEEVARGVHDKIVAKKSKGKPTDVGGQMRFDEGEE